MPAQDVGECDKTEHRDQVTVTRHRCDPVKQSSAAHELGDSYPFPVVQFDLEFTYRHPMKNERGWLRCHGGLVCGDHGVGGVVVLGCR